MWAVEEKGGVLVSQVIVVQTALAMTSRAVLYQYWPNEYKDKIARQKSKKSHFCKFMFLPKYTQEVVVVQTAPAMTSLAILYQNCKW